MKERVLSNIKSIQLLNILSLILTVLWCLEEFWFLQWKCIPSDLEMILTHLLEGYMLYGPLLPSGCPRPTITHCPNRSLPLSFLSPCASFHSHQVHPECTAYQSPEKSESHELYFLHGTQSLEPHQDESWPIQVAKLCCSQPTANVRVQVIAGSLLAGREHLVNSWAASKRTQRHVQVQCMGSKSPGKEGLNLSAVLV